MSSARCWQSADDSDDPERRGKAPSCSPRRRRCASHAGAEGAVIWGRAERAENHDTAPEESHRAMCPLLRKTQIPSRPTKPAVHPGMRLHSPLRGFPPKSGSHASAALDEALTRPRGRGAEKLRPRRGRPTLGCSHRACAADLRGLGIRPLPWRPGLRKYLSLLKTGERKLALTRGCSDASSCGTLLSAYPRAPADTRPPTASRGAPGGSHLRLVPWGQESRLRSWPLSWECGIIPQR